MEKTTLQVKGMHCTSCEVLIKDSLEETGAIKNISISHKTGKLSLDFDPKKITLKKIKEIVKGEGYDSI